MADILIYHNGECSKCRGALEILQEQGIPHDVRWYLADPLSRQELQTLLDKLKLRPFDIIRHSEPLFKEKYEGKQMDDAGWLEVLLDNPSLMQRPIVVKGDQAIIARPPKKVLEIL